jgi:hypothetical protein
MEDAKALFCSSKFPWARERISPKLYRQFGQPPSNGSPALPKRLHYKEKLVKTWYLHHKAQLDKTLALHYEDQLVMMMRLHYIVQLVSTLYLH